MKSRVLRNTGWSTYALSYYVKRWSKDISSVNLRTIFS
ncbi:unnamed protein product [Acanthoscelides obtectus]|uniref:Uncharacterized protein n=1 Tax=Acanthoscelides obtectus TaxID=200917 RepID=A0A9P0PZQ9_ACAOB|nr:unnamed protein product [Acanthoscelides obtectus]CAK1635328.1 hypothetical protein AOBTE_LOCUS9208 [Acanthoscelides obtectus]